MNASGAPAFLDAEINGQKREVRLELVCRVGRNPGNDLMLEGDSVSRNHALILSPEAGLYYINDLGSSNGTFVNGSRVSAPTLLKDGDEISFGSHAVKFRQEHPSTPPRPAFDGATTNMSFALRPVTVLVADIRDYTGLAQRLDSATITKITGALFGEAGGVMRERHAWGQKFIGDAVMGVWLHSHSIQNEMANVLATVASLVRITAGLQAKFGLEEPIRIGIGINSGMASIGNVGGAATPDYTASGDAVNRAFRLESATKDVGCDVLLGAWTYELIGPLGEVSRVLQSRRVRLKGYAEPVAAWGARFAELLPALDALGADATVLEQPPTTPPPTRDGRPL